MSDFWLDKFDRSPIARARERPGPGNAYYGLTNSLVTVLSLAKPARAGSRVPGHTPHRSTVADVVAANKLECVRGDREVSSVRVGVAVLLPRKLRQLALVVALGATTSTPRASEPVHRSG